ncbi:MAG: anti-sigma factor RsbA family regulatory protein [Acidimicrobiia bacterium]
MGGFRHEAFLYGSDSDYVAGLLPFVHQGLERSEPVLVAVPSRRAGLLRDALGADAGEVCFTDMERLGQNPARIISAWMDFRASHGGGSARGIGEPLWPGRRSAEIAECHRHESLLNVAFRDDPWWLLCPYDSSGLADDVLFGARRTHPFLLGFGAGEPEGSNAEYHEALFDDPLPDPPADAPSIPFALTTLAELRRFLRDQAAGRLDPDATDSLLVAVGEVAANSVRYGGGGGTLRVWTEESMLVAEVCDAGVFDNPLVGRIRPALDTIGGRGLWLANQLCDLVQMRALPSGSVVRLRISIPASGR